MLLAAASACRGGKASSQLEQQLAAQVTEQLGKGIAVSCPQGQPPLRCVAAVGSSRVPIALTHEPGGAAGQVRWRLDGLVVSGPALEQQVSEQLAALGLMAEPRCGASLQPVAAGERVRCELPPLGVAWATVDGEGNYSLELALGEAAAARTAEVDEAELDALSRALDREEGTDGDDVDEGADERDAEAAGAAVPGAAARALGARP